MRSKISEVVWATVRKRIHLAPIATNAGWLILERMTRLALGLVVGAWIARYLGPAQFGELAYVLAFVALFGVVSNLGLDSIVVREIAEDTSRAPEVLGSVARMRVVAGFACWLITVLAMVATQASAQTVILTALVSATMVVQVSDTVDLWFQSQSQVRRTVVAKVLAMMASCSFKIALILAAAPLMAFGFAALVEAGLVAFALSHAYKKFPTVRPWKFNRTTATNLVHESWPFALSAISIMIYMRIDQIMLKQMLGSAELGLYAAALPLSQAWNFIPMTLSVSLAPLIARRRSMDHDQYLRNLVLIFRLFFFLGLVVSVAVSASSGWLMELLYGDSYRDGVQLLRIHAFTNVFIFMGVAHSLWVVNERKSRVRLLGTVVAGTFTVVANTILIPRLGTVAVVWVSVAAQFIAAVGINLFLARDSLLLQVEALSWIRIKGRQT
jgi:O-antigen/teichoic acid export membrane protein